MTTAPAVEANNAKLIRIPTEQIHESPRNSRKHFGKAELEELAQSIRERGQLMPVLVRPRKGGEYELAAGARRRRAAALVPLTHMLAMVRDMDDKEFGLVISVENLQREDLTALEEADELKLMMQENGYTPLALAKKIGKSEKYVYDRVKLLQLTKEAKKLLSEGTITAGHAILLARLAPADQLRAIGSAECSYSDGGLLCLDHIERDPVLEFPEDDEPERVKAHSVRELERWINTNVRFDLKKKDLPELFPESAKTLEAKKPDEKMVAITYEYRVPDAAKDEKERTYGNAHWHRADGEEDSKTCELSVLGVVVAGPRRGDAFRVCVNKDKCGVHWKAEKAKASRAAKDRSKAASGDSKAAKREQSRQAAANAAAAKVEALNVRARKAGPAMKKWLGKKVDELSLKVVVAAAINSLFRHNKPAGISPSSKPEAIIRAVAFEALASAIPSNNQWSRLQDWELKKWKNAGLDFLKLLDELEPEAKKVEVAKKEKKAPKVKPAKKAKKARAKK